MGGFGTTGAGAGVGTGVGVGVGVGAGAGAYPAFARQEFRLVWHTKGGTELDIHVLFCDWQTAAAAVAGAEGAGAEGAGGEGEGAGGAGAPTTAKQEFRFS